MGSTELSTRRIVEFLVTPDSDTVDHYSRGAMVGEGVPAVSGEDYSRVGRPLYDVM